MNKFQKKLRLFEQQNRLRCLSQPSGIDFTSNDYLGMREHPKLRHAALEALHSGMPVGAGGSRLLHGNCEQHIQLEEYAALYFGSEKALYFATGYQANTAIFQALPTRHDVIIYDSLIHASSRDGIQNSNAKSIKIAHNDLNACENALKRICNSAETIWIAIESVYSMDGDLAPLEDLQKLAINYNAILIIDEAHGTGIFGETGKGLSEDLSYENIITLHTCGKALGVAGGIVCGSTEIIDLLINTARPFIYSTAPPPMQAYLTKIALEIIRDEPERRKKLFQIIELCKTLLPVSEINSQIVPIILKDDRIALNIAEILQNAGYDIHAIRPPSVPEGSARLRISLNINLTEEILRNFSICLSEQLKKEAL
ncbi:MAG: 8-amino-7-oxononanoate synthase [Alphaproteobacteria bacterium]|nr:8-amino-7-oxononanoate synthase [Alphaproteobacteria bacterium]